MKVITGILIVIVALLWSILVVIKNIKPDYSAMALRDCQEDEFKGYIPKGSCSCAQELFPDFSVSYDWMDACDVLTSQKSHSSP